MKHFLIILIGLCLASMAPAATLFVSTNNATPTPPYNSWATAATNIQDAVFAATNDVVLVTNGVYTCASSLSGSYRAMIVITNSVTLQSVNGPAVTIVDGGNTGEFTNRCFYINNANAVVSGFTITNGRANAADWPNDRGGGVYIYAYGAVTNCWILGNSTSNAPTAGGGGGVYMYGGTLQNCVIAGNTATNYAGGVYNYVGLVQDCVISNNLVMGSYPCAGGLYLQSGTATACTITMNIATSPCNGTAAGGGVGIDGGTLTNCTVCNNATLEPGGSGGPYWPHGGGISMGGGRISNCNIFSNSIAADSGGGIRIRGTLSGSIVENCTISNNRAGIWGGGILIVDGGTVRNCLIRNNNASALGGGAGGGIFCCYGPGGAQKVENCTIVSNLCWWSGGVEVNTEANVQIVNSIIYSNISYCGYNNNWKTNGWANGAFSNCCTTPTNSTYGVLPGTDNFTNYPKFMDPMVNYRLTNGSPCINTGTNQSWMTGATDRDGFPRILYGIVDIGAYEYLCKGTTVSIQ